MPWFKYVIILTPQIDRLKQLRELALQVLWHFYLDPVEGYG